MNMCRTVRLSKGHQSLIVHYDKSTKHHHVSSNFVCRTKYTLSITNAKNSFSSEYLAGCVKISVGSNDAE